MFFRLLFLFTVVPLVELALLIKVGQLIGVLNTVALVVLTGLLGATLARVQGFGVLRRIQDELAAGQLPGDSLFDGVLILAGALLLLTPGILTDALGFALLLPPSRNLVKRFLKRYFQKKLADGEIQVRYRVDEL